MLGYQPWRCMKHNSIADVVKPRWFLKIVWENFLVNNLRFFYVRIVKGPKSNIFTWKLCAWVIFIILFTGLLCDNSNSLTYEPRKGQIPTLSRVNCVILHLMLAFHSNSGAPAREVWYGQLILVSGGHLWKQENLVMTKRTNADRPYTHLM